MAFSIEEFKSKLIYGLIKPNRYVVNITFPLLLTELNNATIFCESVELPGTQIATTEEKQFGPIRKIPYQNVYTELTLIFMCTRYMEERAAFDMWQSLIVDKIGFGVGYYDEYTGTAEVSILDETNKSVYKIKCFECYPIEITNQPLSYNETDTYLKAEVRLAYRNWEII